MTTDAADVFYTHTQTKTHRKAYLPEVLLRKVPLQRQTNDILTWKFLKSQNKRLNFYVTLVSPLLRFLTY